MKLPAQKNMSEKTARSIKNKIKANDRFIKRLEKEEKKIECQKEDRLKGFLGRCYESILKADLDSAKIVSDILKSRMLDRDISKHGDWFDGGEEFKKSTGQIEHEEADNSEELKVKTLPPASKIKTAKDRALELKIKLEADLKKVEATLEKKNGKITNERRCCFGGAYLATIKKDPKEAKFLSDTFWQYANRRDRETYKDWFSGGAEFEAKLGSKIDNHKEEIKVDFFEDDVNDKPLFEAL